MAGLLAAGLLVAALRGGSYGVVERSEAFIVIWWVLGLAVAFGLLVRRRLAGPVRLALAALVALGVWTTIGLVWTSSGELTFDETLRILGYCGVVALVGRSVRSSDRTRAAAAVLAVLALVCLLALLSRLAPAVLTSATAKAGYQPNRLSFAFNYWNALGCWAAMTLAVALAFSVHGSARILRAAALAAATFAPTVAYLTYSRAALAGIALAVVLVVCLSSHRWLAAFHGLVALAVAAGVVLVIRHTPEIARATGTAGRGAVAGALAAAAALAFAVGMTEPRERLARARLSSVAFRRAAAVIGVLVVVAAALEGPGLVRHAWHSFASPETRLSTDPAQRLTTLGGNRRRVWTVALRTFRAHPVHGIGAGTFEFAWNKSRLRAGHVLDAHSLYLESFAELGVPGGLLIVFAIGVLLVGAVRAAAREAEGAAKGAAVGCAAAFVVYAVAAGVDWMWESTAVTFAGLLLGTVAVAGHGGAPTPAGSEAGASPQESPRRLRRAGFALVAVAAIALQLPTLVAASNLRASQQESARNDLVGAVGDAGAAVRAQPWAASAYLQLGLSLEAADELGPAADAVEKATRHEPLNWQSWLILGRIRAERGQIRSALVALATARRLNPRSPLFNPGVAHRLAG